MQNNQLTNQIYYIGVNDHDIDLFEGQYSVPNGISYNSYVIMDNKVCVMDSVDAHKTQEWLDNIDSVLQGKAPDYFVVLHMEPDHAGSLESFFKKYPTCQIVSNSKVFVMIQNYFETVDLSSRQVIVSEGDTLTLGNHTLHFVMAPMVHWPEVMMAYEDNEKILFSADAFGTFGCLDTKEDWLSEARRYYINIVGKYGVQVQSVLKKAQSLDIQKIYPLHGPVLTQNLSYYIEKYNIWSSYQPEEKGVLIAYASIYGHTRKAAETLKNLLETKGEKNVVLMDLARCDISEAVACAFLYDRLVLASVTYDTEIFPCMREFILHLKDKNYQNRTVAFIENGSWAPMAAKKMKIQIETLKDITFINTTLSIKSALKSSDMTTLENIADELMKNNTYLC